MSPHCKLILSHGFKSLFQWKRFLWVAQTNINSWCFFLAELLKIVQILNRKSDSKGKEKNWNNTNRGLVAQTFCPTLTPDRDLAGAAGWVSSLRHCMLAIALCSWVSIFSADGRLAFVLGMPEYDFGIKNYASFM